MKWNGPLAAALSAASAWALNVQQRTDNLPARVVTLSTERKHVPNPVQRDRSRRRDTVEVGLDNMETLYFVNVSLGTPGQDVRMHLDTGSSDLWVNDPNSDLCSQDSSPCKDAGTYNANASSTYSYVGSHFNISYVDGSEAVGDYVTDTITIGDTTLKDFQFGVGYSSTSDQGIIGIGYPMNEVQVGRAKMPPYDNLPAKMASAGVIQSNAYSLWLNDLDASRGSILFGGIDTEQFHGDLQTLPVQQNGDYFSEFLITLTKLQFGDTVIAEDEALAVLLDSGSSLTYLPDSMATNLFYHIGAQYEPAANAAYVPCTLRESTDTLDFIFSEPRIAIDMSELVLDLRMADGSKVYFDGDVQACLFGIAPAATNTRVLGDTFLRSAYVVYDIDNNEISLAQTNFNATKSNILEITGPGNVPKATRVSNTVKATSGITMDSSSTGTVNAEDGDDEGAGIRSAMANPVAIFCISLAALIAGSV